jgi:hypothetical protein
MPDEYDVEREAEFNREKLQVAIPNRLQELFDIIANRKQTADSWYADLISKILLSVDRTCSDLLKTMEQKSVPAAAWNARNLLELWIWTKYCGASRDNARRFNEDALRDVQGLVDALSKMHELREVPNHFADSSREKIAEVARDKLGLDSLDGSYVRVADAAKSIGLHDWFSSYNSSLSKYAHPTAGLVVGIMHQTGALRDLQAVMTTTGVYFAGQCVISLEQIVLAMPAV